MQFGLFIVIGFFAVCTVCRSDDGGSAARILPSSRRWFSCVNFFVLLFCVLSTEVAKAERVPQPQQLAPGVFAVIGDNTAPAPSNRGAIGNQGILIGDTGVILIDTGTSNRYGAELIATVKRLTDKPIVLAITTHQDPAFIFGNGALLSQGVPILAHSEVAALIKQRCAKCLANLKKILGDDEMAGTEVRVPDRIINGAQTITVAGRVLQILYFGTSSSPGSIGVLDMTSGVLFAGGLVAIDRVPDIKDAQISPWLTALDALREKKPVQVVPGFGPVCAVDRLAELADYLVSVQTVVAETIKNGISLADAPRHAQLPRFENLSQYRPDHDKNVASVYRQMERDSLMAK